MAITFTTEYPRSTVVLSSDGLTNIIESVYCVLTGTDDQENTLNFGEDIHFGNPNTTSFIPFDSITKQDIDGWVTSGKHYQRMVDKMTNNFNSLSNQTTTIIPLNFD